MDKTELKKVIQQEIERTQKQVVKYRELTKPIAPENAIGRVSRMDAINNKSILENALRKAEDRLDKLIHVEDRMQDPDFGICAKCKDKIPMQRIMLRPESRFCVKCAS